MNVDPVLVKYVVAPPTALWGFIRRPRMGALRIQVRRQDDCECSTLADFTGDFDLPMMIPDNLIAYR
jgi:hypothetical protein